MNVVKCATLGHETVDAVGRLLSDVDGWPKDGAPYCQECLDIMRGDASRIEMLPAVAGTGASSQVGGAAERLAAYLDGLHLVPGAMIAARQAGRDQPCIGLYAEDLSAVLAELSRLRADLDAAHRDGWASAMETVAEEGRRECEDVARLEAEVVRLRERERHFATALGVPDGGEYRNDWRTRLEAVLAENVRLRADRDAADDYVKAAERALLDSPHVRDLKARLDAVLAENEQLRRAVQFGHRWAGECPDDMNDPSRDPECPACCAMPPAVLSPTGEPARHSYSYCCGPVPDDGKPKTRCTWPDTDCYVNGPGATGEPEAEAAP